MEIAALLSRIGMTYLPFSKPFSFYPSEKLYSQVLTRSSPLIWGTRVWKQGKELIQFLERMGVSNIEFGLETCYWHNGHLFVTDWSTLKLGAVIEENLSWISLANLCRDIYYGPNKDFDSFLFTTEYAPQLVREMNAVYEGRFPAPQPLTPSENRKLASDLVCYLGLFWPTSSWYPDADCFLAAFFLALQVLPQWKEDNRYELTACWVVIWKIVKVLWKFHSDHSVEELFSSNCWGDYSFSEVEEWVVTNLTVPFTTEELKNISELPISSAEGLSQGLQILFHRKMIDENWFESLKQELTNSKISRAERSKNSWKSSWKMSD